MTDNDVLSRQLLQEFADESAKDVRLFEALPAQQDRSPDTARGEHTKCVHRTTA